jgi:hypothetical protein
MSPREFFSFSITFSMPLQLPAACHHLPCFVIVYCDILN